MLTTVLVVVVVALVALSVFLLLKRPEHAVTRTGARHPASAAARRPVPSFVQLVPVKGDCCESAQSLESHRFAKTRAPSLPLEDCTMPQNCGCQIQAVPDRRSGMDRRTGKERREIIRYHPDEEPRRKNTGRRKDDRVWDHKH